MNDRIILLHGAWHGAWCWERVIPLLKQAGYAIETPNLPNESNTTLKSLVSELIIQIQAVSASVILVGHSMSGVIISQVAEAIPDRIKALVYVAAFIPENRGCLLDEAEQSADPGLSTEMILDEPQRFMSLKPSARTKHLLFNACCEEDAETALAHLQPQVFQPFRAHLTLTPEKFGKVVKRYIVCMKDLTLSPADQLRMARKAGCELIYLEDADHSPFYSTPKELVGGICHW